jgi:hypothetical protein
MRKETISVDFSGSMIWNGQGTFQEYWFFGKTVLSLKRASPLTYPSFSPGIIL